MESDGSIGSVIHSVLTLTCEPRKQISSNSWERHLRTRPTGRELGGSRVVQIVS